MADPGTEKFMKRLVGRTDVEDALQRLNVLTQEEHLMTTAATFQVTHEVQETVTQIETVVRGVGSDTKETKEIAQRVNQNVLEVKVTSNETSENVRHLGMAVRSGNNNIEGARRRAFHSVTSYRH
jgi:hypothetical protein